MSDVGRYHGKRVVIVGGSSGIGLATARLLTRDGARVLIVGHRQASVDQARQDLGHHVPVVVADITSSADVEGLAAEVKANFEELDALVVSAGINGFAPFDATTEALFDQLIAVNARGPYFVVQKLAPLLAPGSGVVFTTSISNVRGVTSLSAYSASKAALRAITRGLARELLPRGIRVNAVSPGAIDTGILDKSMPKAAAQDLLATFAESNPMSRVGTPCEVARAAVFLAFDATFTTGAEFPVDGGLSQL